MLSDDLLCNKTVMCLIKKICVLAINSSIIFSSIFTREVNQYICNVFIRICLMIQKMLSTRVHPIQASLVAIGIRGPSVWDAEEQC